MCATAIAAAQLEVGRAPVGAAAGGQRAPSRTGETRTQWLRPMGRDVGRDDVQCASGQRSSGGLRRRPVSAVDRGRTCRRGCRSSAHCGVTAACASRRGARHIASSSAGTPAPVTPEIRRNGKPSAASPSATTRRPRRLLVDRVHLVRDDDLRLGRERRRKQLQLLPHGVEILDRVAAGRARHVDEVHEHLGALEMTQELVTETQAAMRAFDQPRHVGDDEAAIVAQATTPRFGVSVVNG